MPEDQRDRGDSEPDAKHVDDPPPTEAQDSSKRHKTVAAGELVEAGTYVCTSCGARLVLESASHLPPCPQCYNKKFKHL